MKGGVVDLQLTDNMGMGLTLKDTKKQKWYPLEENISAVLKNTTVN